MAQNHQIRMSLMFDANTSQAKASLKELQASLNNLTSGVAKGEFPMTNRLKEAYTTAEQLKTILNSSINMSTGQFDLSKFNSQLKSAGLSATSLGQKFAGAGATGAQVFTQLSSAIAHAEIPTKRVSHLVENMARSLKSTMQWQISSSVIHGITGAISEAYGYAQDLNKSLNDIRIVTGESIEFMERYATAANKAARALSSTTNEYAKASLIFYQQGLDDAEVAKRTEATIKMANVTGESAQEISSYMTAIWNNFDNGTKSLEYYADAITALGAATASSTEEIAGGMQKFASVAETVGLSYEYAASALATVVAATRQSEETVGTSFKTIFARLSSLSLGETLEDGTNLTKYTAALAKVGISVKDSEGALKSMDQILDELGTKWGTISREQQTALAYTVAGTRQYNNFISLLDNYKDFKINVDLAMDSEGTLNKQQEIYAESWEAAANRAKAAAESIYEKLLDDDFFIDFLNGLEKFLNGFDKFIDAMGGLPGILSLVSSLMLRIFSAQTTEAVRNLGYGIKSITGVAAAEAGQTKATYMAEAKNTLAASRIDIGRDTALQTEVAMLEKKIGLEQTYLSLEDQLSDEGKRQYQAQSALLGILEAQAREKAKQLETATSGLSDASRNLMQEDSYREATDDVFGKKAAVLAERDKAEERRTQANVNLTEAKIEREKKQAQLAQAEAEFQAAADTYVKDTLSQAGGHTSAGVVETNGKYQLSEPPKMKDSSMQSLVDEAYTPVEEAAAKIEKLKKEIAELGDTATQAQAEIDAADMQYTEADQKASKIKAMGKSDAKIELDKYSNYTTGQAQGQVRELGSIIGDYEAIQAKGVNDPNYQQSIEQLRSHLDQFQADYEQELGAETNKIIKTIMQELNKQDPKDIKLDTKALGKELSTAHAKDSQKYKKADAYEIREAMKNEAGIEFTDEKAFSSYAEGLEKTTKATKEANKSQEKYNSTIQQTGDKMQENVQKKLPDAATSFTNLSSGIASAVTALMTFKGVFDVWSNSDMSFGEKLLSTFTSLGFAIPAVVSAISMLQQVNLKAMGTEAKQTIITMANTIATKLNVKAKREAAQASKLKKDSTQKETASITENTGAEIANGAVNKNTPTGGSSKLITSLGPALKSLGLIAVAIGAIVAAIAISAAAYNKAEKAAAKAEKQAEKVKQIASEVKQEYDNIKNSIESFGNIKNKMSELTKGTQEWRDALAESNEYARDLIDKFGSDLNTGDYYFENGEIKFKEGVLEDLEEKQFQKMQQAQASADSAVLNAKDKRLEAEKTNFARENMRTGELGAEGGWTLGASAAGGLAAGAAIGTLVGGPILGTIIGAIVGGIAGGVATAIAGSASAGEKAALDKIAEKQRADSTFLDQAFKAKREGSISSFAEEHGIEEKYLNAILKNETATRDLIDEMVATQNEMQLMRESMSYNANTGKTGYDNSDNKSYIDAYVANLMENKESAEYKRADAAVRDMDTSELNEAYLEALGDPNGENYRIKGNKLQKKNSEGDWEDEIDELTAADKRNLIRNNMIADLNSQQLRDINIKEKQLSAYLAKAGIGDSQTINSTVAANEKGEMADFSKMSYSALQKINLDVLRGTELEDTVRIAKENAIDAWEKMLEDFGSTAAGSLMDLELIFSTSGQEVSKAAYEQYGNMINNLELYGSEQAAYAVSQEILRLSKEFPDLGAELFTRIETIDWSNPEAGLKMLQAHAEELGLSTDLFGLTIDETGKKLSDLDLSPAFLSKLKEAAQLFTTMSEKFKDLKYGDRLTQEDYNDLIADPERKKIADKYVTIVGVNEDGKNIYEYRGFGEEDSKKIKQQSVEDLTESVTDTQENQHNAIALESVVNSKEQISEFETKGAGANGELLLSAMVGLGTNNIELFKKAGLVKDAAEYQQYYDAAQTGQGERANFIQKVGSYDSGDDASSAIASDTLTYLFSSGILNLDDSGNLSVDQSDESRDILAEMREIASNNSTYWANDQSEQGQQTYQYNKAISNIISTLQGVSNSGPTNLADLPRLEEYINNLYNVGGTTLTWQDMQGYAAGTKKINDTTDYFNQILSGAQNFIDTNNSEEVANKLNTNMILLSNEADSLEELNDLYFNQGIITKKVYDDRKRMMLSHIEQLKENISLEEDYQALTQGNDAYISSLDKKISDAEDIAEAYDFIQKKQNTLSSSMAGKKQIRQTKKVDRDEYYNQIADIMTKANMDLEILDYDAYGNITNLNYIQEMLAEMNNEGALSDLSKIEADYNKAATDYISATKDEQDALNAWAESWGNYHAAIEAQFEPINNQIEHINNTLSNQNNIISLLGENWLNLSNAQQQVLSAATSEVATANFKSAYSQYQADLKLLEEIDKKRNSEGLTKAQRAALDQQYKNQEAIVKTSLENMNTAWADALQTYKDTFDKNLALSIKSFEQSIASSYGDLEYMSERFSQQSEIREQYLKDYEKTYHLNKLSKDLQKSMDETTSIRGKQALVELQNEINTMQAEGVEVSQYDLEYMQKKYDLRLAEIALEEAQNAKSQVRLQKMANGSWGYVYTQNENDIADAQATYEEKLFNLQSHNDEYLNTISQQIIQTQQDFTTAIQEIYNSDLSEEEQKKRIDEVTAYYEDRLSYLTGEMDGVLANNAGITGMVTDFSQTLLGAMYPKEYDSAEDIFTLWKNNLGDAKAGTGLLGACQATADSYALSVESIFETLGTTTSNWITQITTNATNLKTELEGLLNLSNEAIGSANAGMSDYSISNDARGNQILGSAGHHTRSQTVDILLSSKAGQSMWTRQELESMSDENLQRAWQQGIAMGAVDLSKGEASYTGSVSDFTREEIIQMLQNNASDFISAFGDPSKMTDQELATLFSSAVGLGRFNWNALAYNLRTKWLNPMAFEEEEEEEETTLLPDLKLRKNSSSKGSLAMFKTGGYTGEWGSEGKLAILHEKEIVLNADDTQNLLHTMKVMDQLIKNIELQALSAALDSALAVPSIRSSGETLQQEVTIHAEFPNATNHSEIEQAFDTLINRASQYANRNR